MVIITLLFSVSAISVSAEDVATSDSDKFDLNLSFPADAKGMKVKDANGGNKLQDAVLVLDTGKGKVDYTVSDGQFYLFDPKHPNNPKYLQLGDEWVKVDRVKNLGPANCSDDSTKKESKKTVVTKQVKAEAKPDQSADCDPVITEECVDPGSHTIYKVNPHTTEGYLREIPVVTIGDNPTGSTYPRDVISFEEYSKKFKR